MLKKIGIFFLCAFIFGACSKKVEVRKDSQTWFKEGLLHFENKKYKKAAIAFEQAVIEADTPEIAAESQLFLGDSKFFMEEYEEAIISYNEYLNYYPDGKYAPQATLRLGLSYYKRLNGIDRDQTNTEEALKIFRTLKSRFPEYASENQIDEKIQKLLNMLAEKEYYVSKFYKKLGHKRSAEARLKNVIENYTGTDVWPKAALDYAELLAQDKERKFEAIPLLTQIMKNKNATRYLTRVSSLLKSLEKSMGEK